MKTKYIKIDSLAIDDTNELFEEICKSILKISSIKAKRNSLGLTGKDKHLEEHKVTANQLLALVSRHDIACELKVSYSVPEESDNIKNEIPKSDNDGLEKNIVVVDMEKQEKEITNPELINTAEVVEKKNHEIKTNNLPEIPDFLG